MNYSQFNRLKYSNIKRELDKRLIEFDYLPSVKLENIGYVVANGQVTYKPYFEDDFAISSYCVIKAKDLAKATEAAKLLQLEYPRATLEIRPIIPSYLTKKFPR